MIVSRHVVNIHLMQSPNQNLRLSKEEDIWKRKIGVQNKFLHCQLEYCQKKRECVVKTHDRSETFVRGHQEGLFKLVMLNFIFKWYNWSNFRLLTASH
jgi:predicted nucleotidyltransferase